MGPREKDELFCVSLHFLWRYDKAEVIEKEELKLELVKLSLWKAADLTSANVSAQFARTKNQSSVTRLTFAYRELV